MIVIIEHYLTPEGKAYFPSWLKAAKKLLEPYKGFEKLEHIQLVKEPERTLILLRFASAAELMVWGKSDDHADLLKLLEPYMIQKQYSQQFEVIG
ncbi:MAG: hypothetical protein CL843_08245 [Crocinitomicaceae bacterium]|nr:hypothetical protein [Crocinitomicaceae bacterium]|tara:strand:- start:5195 stop:5479 length:285 start_codon:yes stop_codon:yes gene_type:complete